MSQQAFPEMFLSSGLKQLQIHINVESAATQTQSATCRRFDQHLDLYHLTLNIGLCSVYQAVSKEEKNGRNMWG